MSFQKKLIGFCTVCLLLLLMFTPGTVFAETKQAELVTTSVQQDLAVMFTFETDVVDITFISPSGERKTSGDADVQYVSGELWSTYRIADAEAGTWSVEYDLGSNSEIEYCIIDDNNGIWLQYLNVDHLAADRVTIAFEADHESEDIYYNYEVYAMSTSDSEETSMVASGSALSNQEAVVEVDLSGISSGSYVLGLDVYYQSDGMELFDSLQSEEFDYVNPNEPSGIENYAVKVDVDSLTCTVDWSEYASWWYDAYRLLVNADGETVYTADLESGITEESIVFPEGTKSLEIQLAYKDGDIWSGKNTKTVSLEDEWLERTTDEISGSSQLVISYKAGAEHPLYVKVNENEGNFSINGEGSLAFDLSEGTNSVYAEMESDNLVYYVIDAQVYYDAYPPEITLYEDLDGMTFYTDSVTILGKISGGSSAKIDGEQIAIGDDGGFEYQVNLSLGENTIQIEAEDVNGNTAMRVLTLYRNTAVWTSTDSGTVWWQQYMPMFVALAVSVVIIILALIFMRKSEKKPAKLHIVLFILWDILVCALEAGGIWEYVRVRSFNRSMSYLELAEKSASEALERLRLENMLRTALAAGLGLLLLSILVTVIVILFKKKKKQKLNES